MLNDKFNIGDLVRLSFMGKYKENILIGIILKKLYSKYYNGLFGSLYKVYIPKRKEYIIYNDKWITKIKKRDN